MAEENINQTTSDADEIRYKERKRILFFGLPWTFTRYTITDELLTVNEGLFTVQENDCYMYKIQDVKMMATLMERIFGLGTIVCYTGDVTNPELKLIHVKHAKEIKSYLLKASEAARIKRRTLHTQDIGADLAETEY
ncbi:MAG: PH domain-containing protein [Roseburia sp.]|nr:PH domain-containing protein [Roseburia sp.]